MLALEITVDSQAAAVVGLGGEVLEHRRVDRPRDRTSLRSGSTTSRALPPARSAGDPARESLHRRRRRGRRTWSAAATGWVSKAPNLGWHDVPLGDALAAALDIDLPVHVANDADLGALAEFRRGAAMGADDIVFVSGEVGVGGGIIIDGQPLTGAAGFAGEIGHMPVNPLGARCRCGSVGCWEPSSARRPCCAARSRAGRRPDSRGRGHR